MSKYNIIYMPQVKLYQGTYLTGMFSWVEVFSDKVITLHEGVLCAPAPDNLTWYVSRKRQHADMDIVYSGCRILHSVKSRRSRVIDLTLSFKEIVILPQIAYSNTEEYLEAMKPPVPLEDLA